MGTKFQLEKADIFKIDLKKESILLKTINIKCKEKSYSLSKETILRYITSPLLLELYKKLLSLVNIKVDISDIEFVLKNIFVRIIYIFIH